MTKLQITSVGKCPPWAMRPTPRRKPYAMPSPITNQAARGLLAKKTAAEDIEKPMAQCPQVNDFPECVEDGGHTSRYCWAPPNSTMSTGRGRPQLLFRRPFTRSPGPNKTVMRTTRQGFRQAAEARPRYVPIRNSNTPTDRKIPGISPYRYKNFHGCLAPNSHPLSLLPAEKKTLARERSRPKPEKRRVAPTPRKRRSKTVTRIPGMCLTVSSTFEIMHLGDPQGGVMFPAWFSCHPAHLSIIQRCR